MRKFVLSPMATVATTFKPSRRPACMDTEHLPAYEDEFADRGAKRAMS